jgi:hypothetical protein
MNETKLLNTTLNILDSSGIDEAYAYLLDNLKNFKVKSSQFYNYLYCLASLLGKKEEALDWIEDMGHEFPPQFESIIEEYISPWLLPISNH